MEERQGRILNSAIEMFGERGYDRTHMSEVARRARVSPRTLYRYFEGKKELFLEALVAATNRLLQGILDQLTDRLPGQDALAAMEEILRSYGDFIRENRGLARIIGEAFTIPDEEVRAEQEASFRGAAGMLSWVIENDVRDGRLELEVEPEEVAWMLLSIMLLLGYAMLLDLDREEVGGLDPAYTLDLLFRSVSGA